MHPYEQQPVYAMRVLLGPESWVVLSEDIGIVCDFNGFWRSSRAG